MQELPIHTWGAELAQIPEREYVDKLGKEKKKKILNFHDPVENIVKMKDDNVDVKERSDQRTLLKVINQTILYQRIGLKDPDVCKFYRIFHGNGIPVCEDPSLHSKSGKEKGLYSEISLINHSCNPNALHTWVMEDFKRKEVRAMKVIEVHEEILINYADSVDFNFGSREFRRSKLLQNSAFTCSCSECSLTGESLLENERIRSEIRKKRSEIDKLNEEKAPPPRRPMKTVKKYVKINQEIVELVKKLDIQHEIPSALMECFNVVELTDIFGIRSVPDADLYRREALEYSERFGAKHLNIYNELMETM